MTWPATLCSPSQKHICETRWKWENPSLPLSSFVRRTFNILLLGEWWECARADVCVLERDCVFLCRRVHELFCLSVWGPGGWHRFKELVINWIWGALDMTRFCSETWLNRSLASPYLRTQTVRGSFALFEGKIFLNPAGLKSTVDQFRFRRSAACRRCLLSASG